MKLATLALTVAAAIPAVAGEEEPLHVEAWIKTGKKRSSPARLVGRRPARGVVRTVLKRAK